jgi:hypothetical protein
MFHIFSGAYQQIMLNPYQPKMPCQKPKVVKVIRIKARRPVPVEQQALHKILSVATASPAPEPEINPEELPVPDAKELTQDLIAAENLLHVYDAEPDTFSNVTDLLAMLEVNKKPHS